MAASGRPRCPNCGSEQRQQQQQQRQRQREDAVALIVKGSKRETGTLPKASAHEFQASLCFWTTMP
jgi:hypothetical protein